MDPVATAYYAAICATLAGAAGRLHSRLMRMLVGAAVGVVAAAALPSLRGFFGL